MSELRTWTPFGKDGTLNVTLASDAWWRRAWARIRGVPIWYEMGYVLGEEVDDE